MRRDLHGIFLLKSGFEFEAEPVVEHIEVELVPESEAALLADGESAPAVDAEAGTIVDPKDWRFLTARRATHAETVRPANLSRPDSRESILPLNAHDATLRDLS
jgi:hypothetical protein